MIAAGRRREIAMMMVENCLRHYLVDKMLLEGL